MMTVYRSKLSAGLVVPIVLITASSLAVMVYEKFWPGVLMEMAVLIFVTHLFATTYYIINGASLKIKCGFFYNLSLPINSVYKIEETNSLLSAPATSLDRLEIFYNRFESVVISPRNKTEFINALLLVNPGIDVRLKK